MSGEKQLEFIRISICEGQVLGEDKRPKTLAGYFCNLRKMRLKNYSQACEGRREETTRVLSATLFAEANLSQGSWQMSYRRAIAFQ